MHAEGLAGQDRWVSVARLLRPQGRRGEILAEPLTDQFAVFTVGHSFQLLRTLPPLSPARPCVLEAMWEPQGRNAGRLVLKLAGVDSISDAEALEGLEVQAREADLPPLDPDAFFVRDLLGCALRNGDQPVGTVTDLQFPIGADGRTRLPDAPDLLVVEPHGAAEDADPLLIPFVKAWLERIDLKDKQIVMHLPPGLLDEAHAL